MKRNLGVQHLAIIVDIAMISNYIAWRLMKFNLIPVQIVHFCGCIVMPVICYVVVEAFKNAPSKQNQLIRVCGFWIISIYPYNLFMETKLWGRQNLIFDLLLVLCTLSVVQEKDKKNINSLTSWVLILLILFVSACSGEVPILPILFALIFYRNRMDKGADSKAIKRSVFFLVSLILSTFALSAFYSVIHHQKWYHCIYLLGYLLAIPLLLKYNGNGAQRKKLISAFYILYTLQFILLCSVFNVCGYSFYEFYMNLNAITVLLMVAFMIMALRTNPSKLQLANIVIIVFSIFFMVGYHLQLTAEDLRVVYAALKIEYFGLIGMLMAFTKFIDEFFKVKLPRWLYTLEEVLSVGVLLCIFAVEENKYFFQYIVIDNSTDFLSIYLKPGMLYIVFHSYIAIQFVFITYLCIRKMKQHEGMDVRRGLYILNGAVFPAIFLGAKTLHLTKNYELSTFGILAFIIFFTLALIKDDYFGTIQTEAERDPLTGVGNRRYFTVMVGSGLAKRKKGALIMLDLDDFKYINDNYGHGVGDKVLATLGESLEQAIPNTNYVSRLGGDEFCIFMQNMTRKEELEQTVENLIEVFQNNMRFLKIESKTTLSIGIAVYKGKGNISFEKLYEDADKALYLAKNSGKGQYRFY